MSEKCKCIMCQYCNTFKDKPMLFENGIYKHSWDIFCRDDHNLIRHTIKGQLSSSEIIWFFLFTEKNLKNYDLCKKPQIKNFSRLKVMAIFVYSMKSTLTNFWNSVKFPILCSEVSSLLLLANWDFLSQEVQLQASSHNYKGIIFIPYCKIKWFHLYTVIPIQS